MSYILSVSWRDVSLASSKLQDTEDYEGNAHTTSAALQTAMPQ